MKDGNDGNISENNKNKMVSTSAQLPALCKSLYRLLLSHEMVLISRDNASRAYNGLHFRWLRERRRRMAWLCQQREHRRRR